MPDQFQARNVNSVEEAYESVLPAHGKFEKQFFTFTKNDNIKSFG